MKVLIPAAGLGTRLRPHTLHRPKPLLPLAGKTVLDHALDRVAGLDITELIFVVGHLGDQMRDYVAAHYSVAARYVVQEELLGQAHAIAVARDFIDGPLLILFVDTIFESDLSGLADVAADGVIFYQEVEDPRRFGVITVDSSGHVATFVEKPEEPTSNRAVVGLYYLKRGEDLIAAIDELMARNIQTKGEFYLADALQIVIDNGARLEAWPVAVWEDCGTVPAVLHTNRYLLGLMEGIVAPAVGSDVALIPPVTVEAGAVVRESVVGPFAHVAAGCIIERSVVGPYVSLAGEVEVRQSMLHDTIVDSRARILDSALASSLVGEAGKIHGFFERTNMGQSSEIDAGPPRDGEGLAPPAAADGGE
ncbi:MAG: sugar nucleotidyltransferase [Anaerolineae bacterium]